MQPQTRNPNLPTRGPPQEFSSHKNLSFLPVRKTLLGHFLPSQKAVMGADFRATRRATSEFFLNY
jgi:hypothetical protein